MSSVRKDDRSVQKDLYGFPVSLTRNEQAERVACYRKSKKRQARDWAFETAHHHIPASVSHEEMKRRCRKGIPMELRPFVWMEISGASQKKAQFASSYFVSTATTPAEGEAHEGHLKQIDLDVPRTFPEHAFFKSKHGQRALTMTLRALAVHMPDVGYCQSLNYVAGLLLLVLDHDPEDAFWVLVVLIENKLVPGTYDNSISGCLREVRVLEGLLQRKMPAVSKHLHKRDVDLIAVVPQWFLSLFSQDFPFETAARVFDALLFEGSKVLHRVAVAMFKLTEPRLLQASDTMAAALSLRSATLRMHDRDLIMRTAVRRVGPLPQATIDKLRASQKPNGLFSVFLSRITLNRKPVKAVPWHSQGRVGEVGEDDVGGAAREGMMVTAKSSAMQLEAGMLPRRHSNPGLRTVQYSGNPECRSVDAPPPADLLASMGGTWLLDSNADAQTSIATSARSVYPCLNSTVDSHDPRTAQLMQAQAVLDHASIRREMEFAHTEAFNFTQVSVVKVSEAAKLSVRSPLLDEEGTAEEEGVAAGMSSVGGTSEQAHLQPPHMPGGAQMAGTSGGAEQQPHRILSMHDDVRTVLGLAAAEDRAASASARNSMMNERKHSSGGTGGTEGSPFSYKLPYPPSQEDGTAGYDGGGLQAVLRDAALASSQFDEGERHTWTSEAVAEAVAPGSGSRRSIHSPLAPHMVDHAVPAIADGGAPQLAGQQFPMEFDLDFGAFVPPQHTANMHAQHAPLLRLDGAPHHGAAFSQQSLLTASTHSGHSKFHMQRISSDQRPDSGQGGPLRHLVVPGSIEGQFEQGYRAGQPVSSSSSRRFQGVTPGESPAPMPGQRFSVPHSHEHLSSVNSHNDVRAGTHNTMFFDSQPSHAAIPPSAGRPTSSRPQNAYGTGLIPTPLAAGSARMPEQRLPGHLSPGVVHGLIPIEALGVPGANAPGIPSEHMPALPEEEAIYLDTAELTSTGHRPPGSAHLPTSGRMGWFADSLFSGDSQRTGSITPASQISDIWHTAEEGFPDSGNGQA